jgi:hypothetical protein
VLNFLHVIGLDILAGRFGTQPSIKATGMPNREQRFVLPILWKCRDLVEKLIGTGVKVSKVSGNCQVLTIVTRQFIEGIHSPPCMRQ